MSVPFFYVNLHILIRTYVISESLRSLSICIIFWAYCFTMITAQGTTSAIFSDGAKMHRQIFH